MLIARTDALRKLVHAEAVRRLRRRMRRALMWGTGRLEGMTNKEMAREAVMNLWPMPLQLNMV